MVSQSNVVYGAVAMSASLFVFTYLQERDREKHNRARMVTTQDFFRAMESIELSSTEKIELRRFWRIIYKKLSQKSPSKEGNGYLTGFLATTNFASVQDSHDLVEYCGPHFSVKVADIIKLAHEFKNVYPDVFPEKQVIKVAKMAATLSQSTTWNGIVETTSSMIFSTSKRFQELAKDTSGEMRHVVHRAVQRYLERALDVVADRLKCTLKDPDMPSYLKTNIDIAVDRLMPDVKLEIFRKTQDLFVPEVTNLLTEDKMSIDTKDLRKVSIYSRLRAKILYHLFPYDKSIWMSFKDTWWLIFTTIGLVPVVGQLWWLFLFIIKDKTDEHQLCQFIIGFKSAQFFTLGLLATATGVMAYIRCIISGSLQVCHERGPGLETWGVFFFILQIGLVWTAFFRLPYTIAFNEAIHMTQIPDPTLPESTQASQASQALRHLPVDARRLSIPKSIADREPRSSILSHFRGKAYRDIFGNKLHLDRGGYLMKFCGYETICLAIISLLSCVILWYPFGIWQRRALFYWLRTTYGVMSFPFLIFKVPVLTTILLHTKRMGYNEYGETVCAVAASNRADPTATT